MILGSAALWIAHIQRSKSKFTSDTRVPPWLIGWINFGIFICVMIVTVVLVQSFVATLLFNNDNAVETEPLELTPEIEAEPLELTPGIAVIAVLMLQLPMLGVYYGARRFYPSIYSGSLNDRKLSIVQALKQAVPLFVRFLPIIWITSFVWTKLLKLFEGAGFIEPYEPQELITLFTAGGDPIIISILVVLAVVLAPIVEETIFRGCIYRFLKSQTTMLPAQIVSGVLFALMHANLLAFVPLVVVGILLARVYEISGNILVPICFHAFFNGFSLLMLLIMSHSAVMQ